MKPIWIALAFVAATAGAAQQGYVSGFAPYVDLNLPGALESVEASGPAHYEKVRAALSSSAADTHILLTTDPPQKTVWFVVGDTTYRARITLDRDGSYIYSAKHR